MATMFSFLCLTFFAVLIGSLVSNPVSISSASQVAFNKCMLFHILHVVLNKQYSNEYMACVVHYFLTYRIDVESNLEQVLRATLMVLVL